jgi:hypothetical protein
MAIEGIKAVWKRGLEPLALFFGFVAFGLVVMGLPTVLFTYFASLVDKKIFHFEGTPFALFLVVITVVIVITYFSFFIAGGFCANLNYGIGTFLILYAALLIGHALISGLFTWFVYNDRLALVVGLVYCVGPVVLMIVVFLLKIIVGVIDSISDYVRLRRK